MLDWGIYDDIEVSLAFLSYTKKVVGGRVPTPTSSKRGSGDTKKTFGL